MEGGAGLIGSGMRMQLDQRSIKNALLPFLLTVVDRSGGSVSNDIGAFRRASLTPRIVISLETSMVAGSGQSIPSDDRRVYPRMEHEKAGL
ncbi:hypothetical protein BV25DRAFT_1823736, partial [Artomyces pyxidatus]